MTPLDLIVTIALVLALGLSLDACFEVLLGERR
ncbi:hypothetical protein B0G82_3944 [Paraburkholderia sp. BL17N1]|nr:hypothetical protein B0G82_3944 [Paraburkholderia sp. BL17N1]